jgi:hypothetical protein
MTKARLAYTQRFAGTISASSSATGYDITNLTNVARWKKWRSSTGTGEPWVKCQRAESSGLTCALIADWKKVGAGAITVQMHTSDAWGAPAFSQSFTLTSPNPTNCLAIWFTAKTQTWMRILFTNPTAVSDYAELGFAMFATYVEPSVNVQDGVGFERVDPSVTRESVGGQRSAVTRSKYHRIQAPFINVPGADRDSLLTAYEAVGVATPFFFAVDGDQPNQICYGRFAGPLQMTHVIRDRWSVVAPFEEDR